MHKAIVRISFSGARREDLRRAERMVRDALSLPAGWTSPRGWIWHHTGDPATLQLIPAAVHACTSHTGGFTLHPVEYTLREWPPADPLPLLDPGPPLTERAFDELAQRLPLSLPRAYREFLLRANGGVPRVRAFRGADGREEALESFFPAEGEDGLEVWCNLYVGRIGDGLLPIARDMFGNLICLDAAGAVHFWDHEQEPHEADAVRIAGDLPAFLASFFDDREEEAHFTTGSST